MVLSCSAACIFWRLLFVSCFICYYILPFWGLYFHLVFCCAKAFKFNWVLLVYFCFNFHYSKRWIIKYPTVIYVKGCSMFFSKSFIAYGLAYKSLIHFEFTFVYGVRECAKFINLSVAIQFSRNTYWKDCLFSIVYSFLLCQSQGAHGCMGLSLGFHLVPLAYISVSVPAPYYTDDCSFVV